MGNGRVFLRSSSCFRSISKSKFLVNRRSYLKCFSWLRHWTKRFCADFSWSDANRMQLIANKTHLSTEWDCSSPENSTEFFFQKFLEEILSKIVYFYNLVSFSPLPFTCYSFFFFCSRPNFIDKLAQKHLLHRLMSGMMSCLLLHFVYSLFQFKVSAVKNA